jgi:copper chaperone
VTAQTFSVIGLTCDHCVRAVETELGALPNVREVSVELTVGGASTVRVTSEPPLSEAQIAEALDEAGDYTLA